MLGEESRQAGDQPFGAECRRAHDVQNTTAPPQCHDAKGRLLQLPERRVHTRQITMPCGRQVKAAPDPVKKRYPKLGLEFEQFFAYRALR